MPYPLVANSVLLSNVLLQKIISVFKTNYFPTKATWFSYKNISQHILHIWLHRKKMSEIPVYMYIVGAKHLIKVQSWPYLCLTSGHQIRPVKLTTIDSTCLISSPNPMFDYLLESSQSDDSNKWSNIGFGEETGIIDVKKRSYLEPCSPVMKAAISLMGLKPQRPLKSVRAMAISGLWLESL